MAAISLSAIIPKCNQYFQLTSSARLTASPLTTITRLPCS